MDDFLAHYGRSRTDGAPVGSGRYPLGSGEDPHQHEDTFLRRMYAAEDRGLNDKQIAEEMGMKLSEYKKMKSVALDQEKLARTMAVVKMVEQDGLGWTEIGKIMGKNESSIRSMYTAYKKGNATRTTNTAQALKRSVDEAGVIDISEGIENYMQVTRTRLDSAVKSLEAEGYTTQTIKVKQLGTGKNTTYNVLLAPGLTKADAYQYQKEDRIKWPFEYSDDGGETFVNSREPIVSVDSKRIMIRYAEDGGKLKDGVIELRQGVPDLSLGGKSYAQVRIGVDGDYYLKGMAMYAPDSDLPPGVDIIYNSNKTKDVPLKGEKANSILKPMKIDAKTGLPDADNPFGASIRRKKYIDPVTGEEKMSPINPVGSGDKANEEGRWSEWSKSLSSQFLSKQPLPLIRKQLGLTYDKEKDEFKEISSLTNPIVKRSLLLDLAAKVDGMATDLKAVALPGQATHVILPITDMPENQIYAPKYKDGEEVILIRYPHGSTYEIPRLIVNNKQKTANEVMGNALDAVGINPKVAEQLSGADFDGDTVVVIPTRGTKFNTRKPPKDLLDFEPKEIYKVPTAKEGGKDIKLNTEMQMGIAANILNDITLAGANDDEIIRAVKYSMVVIDAEKHNLDYKQAYDDFGIAEIRKKYRGSTTKGASTIISKAGSPVDVPERVQMNPNRDINKQTGEVTYRETGRKQWDPIDPEHPEKGWKITDRPKTESVSRMSLEKDAFNLVNDRTNGIEVEYAQFANRMKALANDIRKEAVAIEMPKVEKSAKEAYSAEVASLNSKLNTLNKNKPLEREALRRANYSVQAKKDSNPELKEKKNKEKLKRLQFQELEAARKSVGLDTKVKKVDITDREWMAIQANALSADKAAAIIRKADPDKVRQLAMPKDRSPSLSESKQARVRALARNGTPISEIADAMGVSPSTVVNVLNE